MNNSKTDYYHDKQSSYYGSDRDDVQNVIRKFGTFERALEVGCGSGALLTSLKKNQIVNSATGLDPYGTPPEEHILDFFFRGSIEAVLTELQKQERFDLIIFADVLEHLDDPWTTLRIITNGLLRENGLVVISIPNFRNFYTLGKIIFTNSFRYEQEGVLDKTHLRFFCTKDIVELVTQAGLEVELFTPNFKHKESVFFKKNRLKYLNMMSLNLFPYWIADQVIIVGRKK